jgi:acyl carrier protein
MTEFDSSAGRVIRPQDIQRSDVSFLTKTEHEVAQIFRRILEVQRVLPDDDIFSLGGDSFEGIRIALELEHHFKIELPVDLLETASTVRELAAWIDAAAR